MISKAIERQRNAVAEVADDLQYRSAELSAPDEGTRTITATISTEQPVPMYDYRSGKVIDEVLMARGGKFPSQVPLLDDHSRRGTESVLGSARDIRLENNRWRASLNFGVNLGERADTIWELVRQRHVTDVSIGYRYDSNKYVDIAPGRTETVMGQSFTASAASTLRVVTEWSGREVSTTPIGADDQAKIGRSKNQRGTHADGSLDLSRDSSGQGSASQINSKEGAMNYLEFLRKHGLGATVTEQAEAFAFARTLSVEIQTQFADVCRSHSVDYVVVPPAPIAPVAETRSAPATQVPAAETADQIRAERERVAYIYQQRGTLPDELVSRSIVEGWNTSRVNSEFAAARAAAPRTPAVSAHAPAGHTVDRTLDLRTLQAAMLLRSKIQPDSPFLRSQQASVSLSTRDANADWLTRSARSLQADGRFSDDASSRAFDKAYAMRNMSMIDICRAALDLEGIQHDRYDNQDILQRSFSTATLNAIFTTNFSAQMLEGFVGIADTTIGWTAESELPNFLTAERIQGHKFSRLRKVDRNQEIQDASVKAVYESYKLTRYAEKFTVDEMDIIDDRFGMINMSPRDMGEAAGELRPDLVYSILLGNPTMGQDSIALFDTNTHANYTASGAALSSATLADRKSAMATQTSNGRLLNIRGEYLIVPETKSHVAEVLVGSSERRDTTSSTEYGTKNWAQGKFNVVSEPRLDAGLVDPTTDLAVAGQAGSWFLATGRGRYGIEVGYLKGTGGVPVVRRYTLNDGLLGVGWMVVMYVAAKAVGYQGLACSKA